MLRSSGYGHRYCLNAAPAPQPGVPKHRKTHDCQSNQPTEDEKYPNPAAKSVPATASELWKKVQTLVDVGDYDQTIALAKRKLEGDGNKSPKYVKALETAFKRANAEDLEGTNRMKGSATPDWVRIHGVYQKINDRQLTVSIKGVSMPFI